MALSIKDPETERLVRALAARRKTGVTGAIKLAVDNQLKRDAADADGTIEQMRAATRALQDRVRALGGLPSMEEMDAETYDENGAPR